MKTLRKLTIMCLVVCVGLLYLDPLPVREFRATSQYKLRAFAASPKVDQIFSLIATIAQNTISQTNENLIQWHAAQSPFGTTEPHSGQSSRIPKTAAGGVQDVILTPSSEVQTPYANGRVLESTANVDRYDYNTSFQQDLSQVASEAIEGARRFGQGTLKSNGHLGDKLIEGMIEMATPDASENVREIQRDVVKCLVDPNKERANRRLDDMLNRLVIGDR